MYSKIFVQLLEENFDDLLDYAKKNGHNLEIASFAFPEVLDTHWNSLLKEYKSKLKGFGGIISMHGAFQDLILSSIDSKIRKVSEERIIHNLEIAKDLGAKYIVFHTNFNSRSGSQSYAKSWLKRSAEFYKSIVDKYKITIVLENLFDPFPNFLKELIESVNSPYLRVCFDVGHANVYSKVPINEWLFTLKEYIVYIHVNDNKGESDEELIPGDGKIDWKAFSDEIKKNKIAPNIIFEVFGKDKTVKSIDYFKKNKIYPF